MAELDPSESSEVALKANGMPAHRADETVSRLDATRKDSLLRLVRSGIHTGAEWEPGLANVTSPCWTAVTGRSSSSRGNSPPH
ncbi:hypothetical protein [Streptomyces akebiae]|uniref:Uncharacterized protein n=1 Tax=Streptomyces akebiae TaxID=2865673 RepID=A0ABX8XJ10_9ACTN|nr:hypothetical protein [Streptomyces akebiae]QYX75744.1 hypothetical protein K1J60_03780 [Streptomyces akebiae]